jgi:ABC-type branched-subunit amino acid transport system substrate-binding protein
MAFNPELMSSKVSFPLVPTFGQQFESLIDHLVKKEGGKVKIFTVLSDVPGTPEAIAGLTRAATAAGGEFVGSAVVPPAETDFAPIALRIKNLKPDYVAINLSAAPSARFFNALKANDAYPSKFVIGGPVNLSASFLAPVQDAANNHLIGTSMITPPDDPRSKSCVDAIKKYAPDLAIDWYSLWGCATAQVTTTALTELGPNPTRAGLIKMLDGWRDKTASPLIPPLTFGGSSRLGITSMSYVAIRNNQKLVIEGDFKLLPTAASAAR